MDVKELFDKAENGTLTYEQFIANAKTFGAKFVDLKEGHYVAKSKYDDDVAAKDEQIKTLSDTISARDTDLQALNDKLAAAGTDAEKLTALSTDFNSLKSKYDNDIKNYKAQLAKQAYEFAVKEFAGSKKFSSAAAKRDFIRALTAKDLQLEDGKILGAEDFAVAYSKDNADAFERAEEPTPAKAKPTFVAPTSGGVEPVDNTGGFSKAFHFTEIHPRKNNDD